MRRSAAPAGPCWDLRSVHLFVCLIGQLMDTVDGVLSEFPSFSHAPSGPRPQPPPVATRGATLPPPRGPAAPARQPATAARPGAQAAADGRARGGAQGLAGAVAWRRQGKGRARDCAPGSSKGWRRGARTKRRPQSIARATSATSARGPAPARRPPVCVCVIELFYFFGLRHGRLKRKDPWPNIPPHYLATIAVTDSIPRRQRGARGAQV
jgi:hypothetical protein